MFRNRLISGALLLLRHGRQRLFCSFLLCAVVFLAGCTAKHYRKSADNESYKIIQEKQKAALGQTNDFTINGPYSNRKPSELPAKEILDDRFREGSQLLTLPEALKVAVQNSRQYQLRKETLYLSALTLTRERWAYVPQFFASTGVEASRDSNGDTSVGMANRLGMDTLFKTGGRLGLDIANDLLRFYSGGRPDSAFSTITLSLAQPLLRGAGAKVAAEGLTQAERNVIYEIRNFSYYQDTFAFDIVSAYLRLLQQQDTVRNQFINYTNRVGLRERSVALAFDRLQPFQADQAAQDELTARNTYILAVERYRASMDSFKLVLGLPLGIDIRLDDNAMNELQAIGLVPLPMSEHQAYDIALKHRLDLLNEIDIFEDSKRKIVVAADALKPDLLMFTDLSLRSEGQTDYARFDIQDYRINGGIQLDLPLNRLAQRNVYRTSILNFERQIRTLATFLDDLKNDIRSDLRTLDQSRQSYEIQASAITLANRRVESAELLLQAGRNQVRDVSDAQNSQVVAANAVTATLVDYHLTRLRLLLDLGILKTAKDKFWLDPGELPNSENVTAAAPATSNELITPEQLFRNEKR